MDGECSWRFSPVGRWQGIDCVLAFSSYSLCSVRIRGSRLQLCIRSWPRFAYIRRIAWCRRCFVLPGVQLLMDSDGFVEGAPGSTVEQHSVLLRR